ncbi:phosphatidylinositol synthase [Myriangium duriaei CBS 260.36]|uniref:Phosphatidylinositol synthase n=1 Tax=Myriangium duriaei CBS 260.36 TaxID=1168546 RepID=A0A9P4MFW6_9PEZI|nr:phosphatidylinositol synthase [Myriangium duriaei CBS 260.36]
MATRTRSGKTNGSLREVDGQHPTPEVKQTDENIFLFVPNLIGYARVVLAVISLYYMPLHPRRCSFLYSISCLLDALDGAAARKYQQSTRFGAVLDMVTDRCTTTCLLVFLSTAKPRFSIIFQLLISLDFTSHYMHMYATLAMGGSDSSHKQIDAKRSWIMHLYYSNRNVLFVCCALNELFFIGLYLLCFSSPLITPSLLQPVPGSLQPGSPAAPDTTTSPWSAAAMEMARANKMDSSIPWIICAVSTPVMLFKQFVNVLQIVKASKWLAEGDRKERAKLGLPKKSL